MQLHCRSRGSAQACEVLPMQRSMMHPTVASAVDNRQVRDRQIAQGTTVGIMSDSGFDLTGNVGNVKAASGAVK